MFLCSIIIILKSSSCFLWFLKKYFIPQNHTFLIRAIQSHDLTVWLIVSESQSLQMWSWNRSERMHVVWERRSRLNCHSVLVYANWRLKPGDKGSVYTHVSTNWTNTTVPLGFQMSWRAEPVFAFCFDKVDLFLLPNHPTLHFKELFTRPNVTLTKLNKPLTVSFWFDRPPSRPRNVRPSVVRVAHV